MGEKKSTKCAAEEKEVDESTSHNHATIEHQGVNDQYLFLQTSTKYKGKHFHLLISLGSTRFFISPKYIRASIYSGKPKVYLGANHCQKGDFLNQITSIRSLETVSQ